MNIKKLWIPGVLVALVVAVLLATEYYTDYLWYQSLDAAQVFIKPFVFELSVKAGLWVFGFLFLLINLLPLSGSVKVQRLRVVGETEVQSQFRISKKLLTLASAGISLFWVWVIPSLWDRVLLWVNSSPTGQVDPILGLDISWYLFSYPVFSVISGAFVGLLFLTAIAVVAGYALGGTVQALNGKVNIGSKALAHFSILVALYMLWFAGSRQLAMADLLVTQSSSLFGAGYTDVNVRLVMLRLLQFVGIALAVLALANIKIRKLRLLVLAPAILLVISIAGGIWGGVVQQFVVGPNQLVRETPYLAHHIEATRSAFGLDNMQQITYPLERGTIDATVLQDNARTIENIRLLDYRPLRQHYHQNQSLRLYYEFNDIDIDRYQVGDEYHQVMLSARELDVESLPSQAQTLINRHFKYTHGHGIVMSPVNRVTANGHPTYFMWDVPVKTSIDIALDRPEIYFGELTNQHVLVKTANGEFGYSGEGDEERVVHYQGTDGVELNPIRRMLYALKFRQPILLLSDEIVAETRIMYHRNINERINRIAPFLKLDGDPYPVVAEGRIFWIVDAYTVSNLHPYSQPVRGGTNYIRNSAKVVVDAYNGTVDIYKFDETDPIINAWAGVFPGLIQDRSEFPTFLESHIRYPLDYFEIQADILKTYHMTNPRDFYNREDVWEIAVEKYRGQEVRVEPYYVTMQLPGRDEAEFVLMLPYTPLNRNNMIGWLAAGNDGDSYGSLELYHFPRGQLVEGPSQIEAFIDQDPVISQQISLWDQGGSEVIRGNLLTIPVNGSILYVEPLYISAQNRSVPEMRQVIVYYNDVLVMEPTLDAALERIFGIIDGDEPRPPREPGEPGVGFGDIQELVQEINDTYQRMEQAAREGRWADYGRHGNELETLLAELAELVDQDLQGDETGEDLE